MTGSIITLVQRINSAMADGFLSVMLLGAGIFFTVITGFVQLRGLKEGFSDVIKSIKGPKYTGEGLSSFQALAAAVGAQVGVGNIVGAAGAILIGGPGAVFWMWVTAFLSMPTIYAEAVLAQKTKIPAGEGFAGGSVYYIKKAFPGMFGKLLRGFFALSMVMGLGFFGVMVQSGAAVEAVEQAFHIPPRVTGLFLTVLCALTLAGGEKGLGRLSEKLVPAAAIMFTALTAAVLAARISTIPQTFSLIFRYAFRPDAILGGTLGSALKKSLTVGVKRGLFSHEAGMGSTPHAHALARCKNPHQQGCAAMVGVFIDTFVILTLNALVIISVLYTHGGPLEKGYFGSSAELYNAANLTESALSPYFGQNFSAKFIGISLFIFSWFSILGWNIFGKINFSYLTGGRAVWFYTLLSLIFVYMGAGAEMEGIWAVSDLFSNFMVTPNLLALFRLHRDVSREAGY